MVAATFHNPAAPQAPARNPSPTLSPSISPSQLTYNSHRRIKRPKIGDRKVYRPVRRHTLSRIDEAPVQTLRARSKSLQHSNDFSSTRPILRSRSNISADTSRSVPVCNQSREIYNMNAASPQYDELRGYDSESSYDRPSVSEVPVMMPIEPLMGGYLQYPECSYYTDVDHSRLNPYRWKYNRKMKKLASKHSNLYLAFMY